ncbi:MAG: hypothetical protein LBR31_03295 [Desulfovibrio sp.]|jgi:hypothetical protein|nr:hypothetical protein [Desulfovibrio sp.]
MERAAETFEEENARPEYCRNCVYASELCDAHGQIFCQDPFAEMEAPEAPSLWPIGRRTAPRGE